MPTSISILRFRANAVIDRVAGDIRLQFITDVAGQQAVYLEKRTEAALYLAAHAIDPVHAVAGPHITAEAFATSATVLSTAQGISDQATAWLATVSPAIEAARVGGKRNVQLATTPEEIEGAKTAAVNALLAIVR